MTMVNRYAQMEAEESKKPAANRYAEMEVRQRKGKKSSQGDLKRDYTWREVPGAALNNIKQDAVNIAEGVARAYHAPAEVAERAYQATESVKGGARDLGNYVVNNKLASAKAVGNAMLGLPAAVGDYLGTNYGDEGSIKRSIAEHPYRTTLDAATLATLPAALPGQAGVRAAQAGAQVPRAARYAASPGLAVNDAAAFVGSKVLPAAGRIARDASNPTNAMIRRNTEGFAPAIATRIASGKDIVAGSVATPAQLAADVGSTRFSALSKAAEGRAPTLGKNIQRAQNSADLNQVRQVGGTSDQLNALTKAHKARTTAEYAGPNQVLSTADDDFHRMLNLPLVRGVLKDAEDLAITDGRQFRIGQDIPAHTIPDPYGQNLPPIQVPAQFAQYPGKSIHDIKKALDARAFREVQPGGLGPSQARAIKDVRDQFLDWVDGPGGNPGYKAAKEAHRSRATDLDRMRFGQEMENILTSPLVEGETLNLRAERFARALDTPVTKTQGYLRETHPRDLLTPEQMKKLTQVKDDLARQAMDDDLARAGSRYGSEIGTGASDALHIRSDNMFLRPFVAGANKRVEKKVSEKILTREGALELVNAMMKQDAALAPYTRGYGMTQQVNHFINPYRYANRYPMLYNTTQQEQQ